eukprot:TRINITY_DN94612_c0_g1_i1.p1 TRINITY_DN94612_c0_g1~~TRINITY_DN94612_c0_g1_i1.p1  ORF type:complete len:348 (-),score=42.04 TRINITY_DN94612_c0_g1_i1:79-1122(-)
MSKSKPLEPLRHSNIVLSTGITMHIVEAYPPRDVAFRGTVVCCHGYPDTWYGWRKQMRPFASLGFHVVVPDQRGYGDSSSPGKTEAYTMQILAADNIALLDALGVEQAIFLGHDFGGKLVWDMCLHHRDRCFAVGSVCTLFFPNKPTENPWKKMQHPDYGERFNYQLWHQTAEAEMEIERNVERFIKLVIRGSEKSDVVRPVDPELAKLVPTVKGGTLAGLPENPHKSDILTDADVAYYARQFKTSGLRGPLNWYRNVERNWVWNKAVAGVKVEQPSLMITVDRDPQFLAEQAQRMLPHFHSLTIEHVKEAGHWVLQEKPEEVNRLILNWLSKLPPMSRDNAPSSRL